MRNLRINGRRGAFQVLFSLTYVMLGLSYLTNQENDFRAASFGWITEFVPLHLLAGVWVVAATVGLVSAVHPRPTDRHGFQALTAAPAFWGSMFFIGGLSGVTEGFVYAGIYWTFAGVPMIVAGMQGGSDRDLRLPDA